MTDKPLKILYHHRIASKDGQYVHVEEIINALKQENQQIILVAPKVAENSDFGSDGGFVDALKAKLPQFIYELLEFTYAFYALLKLSIAIIKHKPDAIYERYNLFLPAGIWASKLFNLPLLLEVNAPLYQERKKYNGISMDWLAKWSQHYCWKNANKVLPVTNVLADYIREIGVSEDKIQVIPNGINEAKFLAPTKKPSELPDLTNKTVIGFVGFVRDWHGLDRVLEIMAKLNDPSLFFMIIGDGPAVENLKAQAESLNLSQQIYISGIIQRNRMPDWLSQVDVALQPDVVAYASPLKMLEYLALGKAIIAPNTPNIRELLVDQQNALLFNSNSTPTFSDCLTRMLSDKNLSQQLAEQAAQTISQKKLTWLANAQHIITLFKKLKTQDAQR
ncbi:glycosyltransferase family 4 protein [Catenovulum adriaticum]|uniref:Glycosyltransferase family 4 protein n=1 Tax=Catenovulum adriaticum TaxID=2984846 RepID=A0ABY7AMB7_9ALTE|nr:glycosyltransferase family 4 protein [Catenovulum sp. TS8]WAJ70702.1 glycosyltransferase family 4 protein [Catenovulum sp. TS8]